MTLPKFDDYYPTKETTDIPTVIISKAHLEDFKTVQKELSESIQLNNRLSVQVAALTKELEKTKENLEILIFEIEPPLGRSYPHIPIDLLDLKSLNLERKRSRIAIEFLETPQKRLSPGGYCELSYEVVNKVLAEIRWVGK
jgi:hypothetical protein